jgi:adenylate cyclase
MRFYLPEPVAVSLAEAPPRPEEHPELVFSTCLVSDMASFTSLAERLTPQQVNAFLNHYFERLFACVQRNGGIVTDVIGDGMTAVWSGATPARAGRLAACRAALAIQRRGSPEEQARCPDLTTRIGLHSGWVVLGNVGGSGRLVYSVVGDIVNTAARIETLNKQLGTRLLATDVVVQDLDEVVIRPLGRFLVVGKKAALPIVEVLGLVPDAAMAGLLERSAEALAWFHEGNWANAAGCFRTILDTWPEDGPARFYLRLLDDYRRHGPPEQEPTVVQLALK